MKSSRPIRRTSRPAPWQRRGRGGAPAAAQQIREVFFCATRDSKSGVIYLKVVNSSGSARPITSPDQRRPKPSTPRARPWSWPADSLDDTNSIDGAGKIVPRTEKVDGLGADFTREFPAYSVTVLEAEIQVAMHRFALAQWVLAVWLAGGVTPVFAAAPYSPGLPSIALKHWTTARGCRGSPSTICMGSPPSKSSTGTSINDWPKGTERTRQQRTHRSSPH